MVGLVAWPGPHTRSVKPVRVCAVDTMIQGFSVEPGEQGRAMGYLNAECTCCFASPLSHSGHFGAAHKGMPSTVYGLL